MRKYRISPLMLMTASAFIVIDGSWFAVYAVIYALWHELWHIIVLRLVCGRTRSVSVGGYAIALKTDALGYMREAAVALAGPASSLAACCVFAVIARFFAFNELTVFSAVSNFAIFAVNILPIYPLDGGRALHCVLSRVCDISAADRITKIISFIFLLPLSAFSVIILIKTGYNLSLAVICLYLAALLIGVRSI